MSPRAHVAIQFLLLVLWGFVKRGQRKFQVMTEICRKISRYARKEFHLMTESSA